MPTKYSRTSNKIKEVKDYRCVEPTITLIWLVGTDFNFDKNFVSYSMFDEDIAELFRREELWSIDKFSELKKERNKLLKILDSKTHSLDFLQTNKLTFMFQSNIIKDDKDKDKEDKDKDKDKEARYKRWFSFAEATRQPHNTETDFDPYKEDKIFQEIIRRLRIEFFNEQEFEYLEKTDDIERGLASYDTGIYHYGFVDGKQQGIEQEKKNSNNIIKQANLKTNIYKLLFEGKIKDEISQILQISVDEIERILTDN